MINCVFQQKHISVIHHNVTCTEYIMNNLTNVLKFLSLDWVCLTRSSGIYAIWKGILNTLNMGKTGVWSRSVGDTGVPWDSKVYFVCHSFVLQGIYTKTKPEENTFIMNYQQILNKYQSNIEKNRFSYLSKMCPNGPEHGDHWDSLWAPMGHQTKTFLNSFSKSMSIRVSEP